MRRAFIGLIVMCLSRPALAEEASDAPSAQEPSVKTEEHSEPARTRRWYGWQTLIVDSVSVGLLVVGFSYNETGTPSNMGCSGSACPAGAAFIAVGSAGYLLGGPVVHWLNGNGGAGFGSFGLRIGIPIGAGLIGLLVGPMIGNDASGAAGPITGAVVGVSSGALVAMIIDASLLAYKDVPRRQTTVRLAPWIDPKTRGTGLTLRGAF